MRPTLFQGISVSISLGAYTKISSNKLKLFLVLAHPETGSCVYIKDLGLSEWREVSKVWRTPQPIGNNSGLCMSLQFVMLTDLFSVNDYLSDCWKCLSIFSEYSGSCQPMTTFLQFSWKGFQNCLFSLSFECSLNFLMQDSWNLVISQLYTYISVLLKEPVQFLR